MKKNISINLQGIIFHIEEDGYEQLRAYLTSIRTYFSNYEGHEEIIADIEGRIAEIFSMRLAPGKEVITQEDVQALIAQMGGVTDFEILEPMDEEIPYTGADSTTTVYSENQTYNTGPKKLYRDINRKVVAGVCSGIANYLNIDVVWIRLFFVLFVVLGILSAGISAALGIFIYIILWIAMPQNDQLPETTVKKLYRDPDDKKLAGVASGVAKYFGTDVAVIRILFLVSFFLGGFGLILYIVLWIAVPLATTLTERMQMQGDPVTLAGIERTLKDNLNMKDHNGEENTLAKIILLPIRLIAQIFNWMGTALGPVLAFLVTLIRIGAGVFLLATSIGLLIALFTTFFISIGAIENSEYMSFGDFPASVFLEGFPQLGLVTGFLVGLIPLIFLIFLAIGLLAKRFFLRPIVGWSMFGLWLVALIIMIASIAAYATNFKRSGEITTTKVIPVAGYQTVTLDAYDTGDSFDHIYVDVREHNGDNIEIIQTIEAKGRTEEEAKQHARMVTYRVVQQDSVIRFDDAYQFKKGAAFRDQDLEIKLMLPKNKKIRLTEDFIYMLPSATFMQEYSNAKIARNTWQVKGDQLECLTCAADTLDTETDNSYEDANVNVDIDMDGLNVGTSALLDKGQYSSNTQTFDYKDFDEVSIGGPYHVQIRQGNTYSVKVQGKERDINRMEISKRGSELNIEFEDKTIELFDDRDPILILITAPEFSKIDLSGAIKADIGNISGNNLELGFYGATKAAVNVRTQNLKVDIAGASTTSFRGTTEVLELDASGACKIDANQLKADEVTIETSGVTKADVYAVSTLRADASGASNISYRGNPGNTTIDASGASKINRK